MWEEIIGSILGSGAAGSSSSMSSALAAIQAQQAQNNSLGGILGSTQWVVGQTGPGYDDYDEMDHPRFMVAANEPSLDNSVRWQLINSLKSKYYRRKCAEEFLWLTDRQKEILLKCNKGEGAILSAFPEV